MALASGQQARYPSGDAAQDCLRDPAKASLRVRPIRVIIGDVRSGERSLPRPKL